MSLTGAILLLCDGGVFAATFAGFWWIAPATDLGSVALFASACVLALLAWDGLYPGYRLHPHEILKRRSTAFAKVGLACFVYDGVVVGSWSSAGLLAVYLAVAGTLQIAAVPGVQWLLHRFGLWGVKAQIVAEPVARSRLEQYFRENWRLGVIPVTGSGPHRVARTALVAQPLPEQEELEQLRGAYETLVLLADMPEVPSMGLRLADVNGEIGLRLSSAEPSNAGGLRRAADLMVALLALVCFAPIIAFAAVLIWIVDPGPVFFRQAREGQHGRTVRIFKLRTMYQDAEERLEALLASDAAAREEWQSHFKLRDDPRVLPIVGNFLRSSSCDELPQLINIVTGDMGLVGPRPFPSYHLDAMPSDFRKKRATVAPGLTGLWQVSARSEADIVQAQMLDEFYIDNRSLWLDLSILLRTFSAVMRRTGAY